MSTRTTALTCVCAGEQDSDEVKVYVPIPANIKVRATKRAVERARASRLTPDGEGYTLNTYIFSPLH